MSKKTFGVIILILVSILILVFSFFEFKKFNNKMAKKENSSNNQEANSVIEENTINGEENSINEIIDNTIENTANETSDNQMSNETIDNKETNNVEEKNEIKNETAKNQTEEKATNNEDNTAKNETKNEIANNTTDSNSKSNKENRTSKVIVIDPGHQRKGDNSKEPIGPGATETKAKVTTGATGTTTKQLESELNLSVSLLLQKELKKRGYTVIMTRTTQDVNISNSARAKIANDADADAFVRIHADSSTASTARGMSALCQTTKNKYNGNIAIESYSLSKSIIDNMVKQIRTDTMSGINWATVPTTIIEMGFLSNPEEDRLLASESYQNKIVKGIADGIDGFLK